MSLSLVRRIQLLRPLPLNSVAAATETAEESERSDSESSSEEEEEETNENNKPPRKIEFAEWKGKRDKKKAEDRRRHLEGAREFSGPTQAQEEKTEGVGSVRGGFIPLSSTFGGTPAQSEAPACH